MFLPFWIPGLLPVLIGGDPVETDLQKPISEYCALEKMDRILLSVDRADETESIGLRVREMRRWEIHPELTTWINCAEAQVKQAGRTPGSECAAGTSSCCCNGDTNRWNVQ